MRRATHWLTVAAVIALVAGLTAPQAQALVVLDDAQIFIEINDTDGDAGIQIKADGEDWEVLNLLDPNHNRLLSVRAQGSIALQGLTEMFFESAEPSFDEQTLDELLALFPEGVYRFNGRTTEGERIIGRARLTHALPEGPVLLAPMDGDDSVDPDNTVIKWMGVPDPPGSRIVGYQVIVEREEPRLRVFSADMARYRRRVTVPPEFMEPGTEYKYEVLAIEKSGNQTISEAEFETAD